MCRMADSSSTTPGAVVTNADLLAEADAVIYALQDRYCLDWNSEPWPRWEKIEAACLRHERRRVHP